MDRLIFRLRQAVAFVLGLLAATFVYLVVRSLIDAAHGGSGDIGPEGAVFFALAETVGVMLFGVGAWIVRPRQAS
jgi:hypothetical protein